MKDPRIRRSGTLRGRHGVVFLGAAALALVIGITGVRATLQPRSSTSARPLPTPSITPDPAATPLDPTPVRHPIAPATTTSSPTAAPTAEPTVAPAPDPTALADGVYPTFVRGVNVERARIHVDVLQSFFGAARHQAAIEDGVDWKDVRYDPVYLRNENPLMRTLPVAEDVRIKLIGVCLAPDRTVGLTQLREEIWPHNEGFYYDVTVVGGSVEAIMQKIALAGC